MCVLYRASHLSIIGHHTSTPAEHRLFFSLQEKNASYCVRRVLLLTSPSGIGLALLQDANYRACTVPCFALRDDRASDEGFLQHINVGVGSESRFALRHYQASDQHSCRTSTFLCIYCTLLRTSPVSGIGPAPCNTPTCVCVCVIANVFRSHVLRQRNTRPAPSEKNLYL